MIEISEICKMMETMLNDNDFGINFNISADRNQYMSQVVNCVDFTIPGVLTTLSGNYEPVQGIKIYNMPVDLELFGYTKIEGELPPVPFSIEQIKECVGNLVEHLNGTTQTISQNAVIFSGTVVTVGSLTNNCGGGYTRIPVTVKFYLTVVEKATLFNDLQIKFDGQEMIFSNFNIALVRQGESITTIGTTLSKSLYSQMSRIFSGTAFMLNDNLFTEIQNEILSGQEINKKHTLTVNDKEFIITISEATISGQMGSVMQMSLTMSEAYNG